jgi:hypothetical protein
MQALNYLAAAALCFAVAWIFVILATAAGY